MSTPHNRYRLRKGARMRPHQIKKLVRYFATDLTATQATTLLGIQRKTVNDWYNYMRKIITEHLEGEKILDIFQHKEDEPIILGISEKQKIIHSYIIPFSYLPLGYQHIIRKGDPTNPLPILSPNDECTGIIDTQRCKYYRLYNCKRTDRYTLGFRSYCSRRLLKFNGIAGRTGLLHIKESQFRFNCKREKKDIYHEILYLLDYYYSRKQK